MNECENCGVELDASMNYCPLCGKKVDIIVSNDIHQNKTNRLRADNQNSYNLNDLSIPQRRKLFWELSGIVLISGIVISFIIDLIINKSVTWSKYSITIGLVVFINLSLITFLKKRIFIMLLLSFISTSTLLVLLDVFYMHLGWGLKIGIPIVFFFYTTLFLLIFAIKKSRQKGINLIAYALIASGIICMTIEGVISYYFNNHIILHWSIILIVSILAVSALLLFIHFRLKKVTELKRFFHI